MKPEDIESGRKIVAGYVTDAHNGAVVIADLRARKRASLEQARRDLGKLVGELDDTMHACEQAICFSALEWVTLPAWPGHEADNNPTARYMLVYKNLADLRAKVQPAYDALNALMTSL